MSVFLSDLINSLSVREKAYFKRYAGTYSGNESKNYLRLYEAVEQEGTFDADNLRQQFRGESMEKHLSSEANYLLEQLMRSLLNYHLEDSQSRKLIKLVLFIDLLTERGFSKQALKTLKKAKKLAYKYEEFTLILKLIQLEESILFKEGILNFTQKLQELKEERNILNEKIHNLNELRLLREQTRELQFSEVFVTDTMEFPHIFHNPLLSSIDKALSISAKEHWYYVKEVGHYLTRNYNEGQKGLLEFMRFMEAHLYFFKKSKILSVLSNYMLLSALLKDQKSFYDAHEKLIQLKKDPQLDKVYIDYISYVRLFELYYLLDDFSSTKSLLKKADKFLKTHVNDLVGAQANYTVFVVVRACIETDQFEEAVDWLNFWHQVPSLEYTLIHRRLFTLIAYFELNWNELLDTEIEATIKTLKSHKKYDKTANSFCSFFKKYLKHPHYRERYLKLLRSQIEQIKSSHEDNKPFEYFDFLKWCDRKLKELKTSKSVD